ncbi:MAG: hypothetical protein A2Y25_07425 [Candidatus Melainabacteria bacterium GWF2_37_15]|nr:MAG: hypothetical protein A2Y25_07425 [Candidatus Melainabacteria bacterium GWF2_37_15]
MVPDVGDVSLIEPPKTEIYYCVENTKIDGINTKKYYKEFDLDHIKVNNARTITKAVLNECKKQGKNCEQAKKAVIIALTVAMQESGLMNIEGSRYKGLFQQDSGWGPREERMDPEKAAIRFTKALLKKDFMNMSVQQAAQAVQRSGNPGAYTRHVNKAILLTTFLWQ